MVAIVMSPRFAVAQYTWTDTWTGATNSTWNNASGNWSGSTGGGFWGYDSFAVFNSTGAGPITVSGPQTVAGVTVNSAGYSFNGGQIVLGQSTGTFAINNDVTISSTLAGGPNGFRKTGAGTLTLSSPTSYSGTTTVAEGALRFGGANILAGPLRVSGGSVDLNGNDQRISRATFDGASALQGSGLLYQANTNNGISAYTGTISLGGSSRFYSEGALRLESAVQSLTINGSGTGGEMAFTGVGGGRADDWANQNVANVIGYGSGQATLTVNNATLAFEGDRSTTTVGGKSSIGLFIAAGVNGVSGQLIVSNSATVRVGRMLNIQGADLWGVTTNQGVGSLTISSGGSVILGTGTVTNADAGLLQLTNDNASTTGTATVNLESGGLLAVTKTVAGSRGTTTINFNGGTLQARVGVANVPGTDFLNQANSLNVFVRDGGGTIDSGTHAITVGAHLRNGGAGGLAKTGSGILTLSGTNTYIGGTQINEGVAVFASKAAMPSSGVVSVAAGAMLGVAAADGNPAFFSGSELDALFGNSAAGVSLAPSSGVGIDTTPGNLSYTATVTGGRGLGKFGTNTLTLGAGSTVSTTGRLLVQSGTLNLGGNSVSVGMLSGGTATTITTTSGASTLTASSAADSTFAGVLSGSVAVVKSGAGLLALTGNSSFSGGTTLNAGTLRIGQANALGTSGTLSFGGNATLQLQTGTSFTLARNIAIGSNNATFDTPTSGTLTLSGVVSGSGALVKTGAGVLAVNNSGSATFSGTATVSEGTLWYQQHGPSGSGQTIDMATGATVGFGNSTGPVLSNTLLGRIVTTTNAFTVAIGANSSNNLDFSATGANLPNASLGAVASASYSGTLTPSGTTYRLGGGGATLTVSSTLTGARDVVVRGPGVVSLSAANTYDGATTIASGTLAAATLANGGLGSSLGDSSSAAANLVIDNATLRYTGGATSTDRNYTFGDGGVTFEANGTGALTLTGTAAYVTANATRSLALVGTGTFNNTLAGTLSDNGSGKLSVAKSGAGRWILSGANTHTGTTSVTSGWLQAGSTSAFGGATATLAADGGIVELAGFSVTVGTLSGSSGATITSSSGTATLTANATASSTYGGIISGTGANGVTFTKAGSGTLAFTGNNTYSGPTKVTGGVLAVMTLGTSAGSLGTSTADATNLVLDGGTLRYVGNTAQSTPRNFTIVSGGGTIESNGIDSNGSHLALTLTGSAAYGTAGEARALTLSGSSTASNTYSTAILDNGGGAVSLAKAGSGLWILSATNSGYTGPTTITGGTLSIGLLANGGAASSIGASPAAAANLVIRGGVLRYTGAAASSDRAITIGDINGIGATIENNGTGPIVIGGSAVAFAAANDGTSLTLAGSNSGTNTFTGNLADNGTGNRVSLVKSGAGTWILTGSNSYSGGTTVNAGTLRLGPANPAALGSSAGGPVVLNGTLDLNGNSVSVSSISGTNASASLTSTGGTATWTMSSNADISFAGTIGGSGTNALRIVKTGTGALTFTGANTYSGGTQIQSGIVNFGSGNPFGTGTVSFSGNSTLRATAGGSPNIAAPLSIASGVALTVETGSASVTLSGALSGPGSLVKSGAGSLTISSATNFSGSVSFDSGLLTMTTLPSGTGRVISPGPGTILAFGTLDNAALKRIVSTTNAIVINANHNQSNALDFSSDAVGAELANATLGVNAGVVITSSPITPFNNVYRLGGGSGTQLNYLGSLTGSSRSLVVTGSNLSLWNYGGLFNTYGGSTTVNGLLLADGLRNGGTSSAIGQSSAAAENLVMNGTLRVTNAGNAGSTYSPSVSDRNFTIGDNGAVFEAQAGLVLTTTASPAFSTPNQPRTFGLGGTNTGTNSYSGRLVDNGTGMVSFTKSGAGNWILAASNNAYTGITRIEGGVLEVRSLANGGQESAIGSSSNAAANLFLGGTLRYSGSTSGITDRNFTVSGSTVGLESSGSGSLFLTGTYAYATANQALTFTLGGSNTGDNTLSNAILRDNGTGALALTKSGGGRWVLPGLNTFSGKTTIGGGTLEITSISDTGVPSSLGAPTVNAQIDIGSGTSAGSLRYVGTAPGGHSTNRTIHLSGSTGGATLDASGAGAFVLASVTAAAGTKSLVLTGTSGAANAVGAIGGGADVSVDKTGSGVWRLTGDSTYEGRLTVSEGTVVVGTNVNALGQASPFGGSGTEATGFPLIGSTASGATGTAALLVEGGRSVDRGLSIAASGSGSSQVVMLGMTGTGVTLFGGFKTISLGRDVTLQAADGGTVRFESSWTGTAGEGSSPTVAINIGSPGNAGMVVFASSISASAVNVRQGTLQIDLGGSAGPIAFTTPVTVGQLATSGTFDLNGKEQSLGSLSFTGPGSRVTHGMLRLFNGGSTATVTGSSGTGHVITSAVALDDVATFNLAGGARLLVSGSIIDGANGAKAFTKSGDGILELTGTNTLTGATFVSAGSLLVNGHLTNTAVTVQSGGLLGGSGVLDGVVSVLTGGTLSPGNSPGLLTTGSLSLAGTTLMEIDGTAPRGGIGGYDAVDVTGLLTYGGDMVIDFGGLITSPLAQGTSFNLFDFGSVSGSFSSITTASDGSWYAGLTFAQFGSKWTAMKDSQTLEFTPSTGELVIVPEPGAIALAVVGVAASAYAARRRRCRA